MAQIRTRGKSKRSGSGARLISFRKTKLYEHAGKPVLTKVGETKVKIERSTGGLNKRRLLDANKINVYNPKTKKYSIETIETVIESPSNSQYVRRNLITKGSIVQTGKGKVKITSRPGQTGFMNGIIVE